MKKPAALPLGAMLIAWSCTFLAAARAQEVATNLVDLAAEAFSSDHCIYLPFTSWEWRAYSLDVGGVLWVDCSQLPCADWASGSTNLNGSLQAYGVVLTRDVLTGETTLQADGSTNVLAVIAAPSDYQPDAQRFDSWVYRSWVQVTNCADCWGIEGEIPPPTVTLKVFLADVNDYAAYESNLEAQAEEAAASATRLGTPFMSMDDEGDDVETDGFGASCLLTNLLQPFSITRIQRITNDWTAITFQSCPMFRYIVLSADVMSSNAVWQAQAYTSYVWGQPTATTWTDTTTTASVTQRFYKVERLNASPIAAGGGHSLAVTPDGKMWAWGSNGDGYYFGNLGDGTTMDRPYPVEMADVTVCLGQTVSNAAAMAGDGDDCTVMADARGTVWTCGENEHGQLGDGSSAIGYQLVPMAITGISNVVSVAAGADHTLALRADSTVWAWGDDSGGEYNYGKLGVGGLPLGETNAPIQTLVLTQIVAVAAGCDHSVALDANGRIWMWGGNYAGQLGNGGHQSTNIPVLATSISNVIAIAAGCDHTVALTADKRVWTWGGSGSGQLGRSGDNTVPGLVTALSNVAAIAGGTAFTLAVTSNGQVYAWGLNGSGQLGTNGIGSSSSPIPVAGISNAVWVAAHPLGLHSVAMTVDAGTNRYWGWGDNTYGDVGNGTNSANSGGNDNQYTPVSVQFCTRCQRCVQLGTSGSFTAQCNGTMYLYFNDDQTAFDDNGTNSYSVTFHAAGQTNLLATVMGANSDGVAISTVTNGGVYFYSASGFCTRDFFLEETDADGKDHGGNQVGCSSINITNAICPAWHCFSLVGRIQ